MQIPGGPSPRKRNTDSYHVQLEGPILAHGTLRGYYLIWPGGFESAMPDKATAKLCAAAPRMAKLIRELYEMQDCLTAAGLIK